METVLTILKYASVIFVIAIGVYLSSKYKAKPNDNTSNIYDNWRHYRVVIALIGLAVAVVISLFTQK